MSAKSRPSRIRRLLGILGPGFITGASDDDPSGIGTYATAGASFGFTFLWTAWVTFPMMATVQFICAKIGLVSGRGLAGVLRRYYPRAALYPVVFGLLVANTINAGADLGAIAAGINLLVPVPIRVLIVPVGIGILLIQIYGSYRFIERTFKWLTLALFAYVGAAFFSRPELGEVLRGTLVPSLTLDRSHLSMLVAVLGTTISPYLFFWQAGQEVEDQIRMGRRTLMQRQGATRDEMRDAAWDVNIGMFFSNAVMYFIILATAATLFKAGETDIDSAIDAARALQPLAGDAAGILLALGLIGTGLLAVPILTGSAAYAIAEAFGWRAGLNEKPRRARAFYGVIVASTLAGMLLDFLGVNPIHALVWTAIINGFLAPPLLVVILHVANNRKVLGDRINGPVLNLLGWFTTIVMFAAAIALVVTNF